METTYVQNKAFLCFNLLLGAHSTQKLVEHVPFNKTNDFVLLIGSIIKRELTL